MTLPLIWLRALTSSPFSCWHVIRRRAARRPFGRGHRARAIRPARQIGAPYRRSQPVQAIWRESLDIVADGALRIGDRLPIVAEIAILHPYRQRALPHV